MSTHSTEKTTARRATRFAPAIGAASLLFLVASCSSVPDWANPVEWYEGATDYVFGDDEAESANAAPPPPPRSIPGENKSFPKLASVPERPAAPTEEERDRMARSLVADRENARYTDEQIKRQSTSAAPPPPPLRPRGTSASPPAVPRTPVASAPTRSAAPPPPPPRSRSSAPRVSAAPPPSPRVATRAPAPPPATVSPAAGRAPAPRSLPPALPPSVTGQASPPQLASAGRPSAVRSLATRPVPGTRSIARIGNPSFGAPPADIAASLGAGTPPAHNAAGASGLARLGQPAGTLASTGPVAGERIAVLRFTSGSARIRSADRRRIRDIARAFKQRGGGIRIEGHASSRTRDMTEVRHHLTNFDVSLKRANAVAAELIRQGVPQNVLFVAALSDSRPIYYEVMPAGELGNQRVEVFFVN